MSNHDPLHGPQDDAFPLLEDLGDLATLAQEHAGELRTYVYQVDQDGRKKPPGFSQHSYLERIEGVPELDDLRDRWGGGLYLLLVKTVAGAMKARVRVSIADATTRTAAPPSAAVPPAAAPPGSDHLLATIATTISESITRALEPVITRIATPPAPAVDTLAVMREAVSLVRELAPPPSAPATDGSTAVDLLLKGMKIGRESEAGGTSLGDALVQVAPQALDTLGRVAATFAQARGARIARPAPAPTPAPASPVEPSLASVVEGPTASGADVPPAEADAIGRAAWLVTHLEAMRLSGADAEKVADVVEDLLTDSELEMLAKLDAPGAVERLGMLGTVPAELASPDGLTWLGAFLDRLRQSDEDEPGV